MHVLQISCYPDPLSRRPEDLLRAWPTLPAVAEATVRAGIDVTVLQAASVNATLNREGVSYRFVRRHPLVRGPRLPRLVPSPALARTAGSHAADLIHFHGLSLFSSVPSVRRHVCTTPIVVQDHGDGVPHPWLRIAARRGLRTVDAALFTAAEQAEPFFAAAILRPGLPIYEVLESSSTFTPGDRNEARRATGLFGDPCLLWIGRLDDNKDPLCVLEAVRVALSKLPGLHLWASYTDAPLLARIRQWLSEHPTVAERVHLMGSVPHPSVQETCRAADFYVAASHREGSGYALIEALACGLPPVVSDIPSFRRITRGAAVGALFPTGNPMALAAVLVRLASSDRGRLRVAARRHFDAFLSFDAVGRELRRAYEDVLSAR